MFNLGIGGDSNTRCVIFTDTIAGASGAIGSRCIADRDCLYYRCESAVCAAPILRCPTAVLGNLLHILMNDIVRPFCSLSLINAPSSSIPHFTSLHFIIVGSVCSGKGACRYTDPSGNMLTKCTLADVHCSAVCVCSSGYGGRDCSLDASSSAARNAVR